MTEFIQILPRYREVDEAMFLMNIYTKKNSFYNGLYHTGPNFRQMCFQQGNTRVKMLKIILLTHFLYIFEN